MALKILAAWLPTPPHHFPTLCLSFSAAQSEGLIPKWLAFTLTQQPALFDRAFQRCFSKVRPFQRWWWCCGGASGPASAGILCQGEQWSREALIVGKPRGTDMRLHVHPSPPMCHLALSNVPSAQELELSQREAEDEADDPMAWAVQRFWKRRAAPLVPSRSMGHLRRCCSRYVARVGHVTVPAAADPMHNSKQACFSPLNPPPHPPTTTTRPCVQQVDGDAGGAPAHQPLRGRLHGAAGTGPRRLRTGGGRCVCGEGCQAGPLAGVAAACLVAAAVLGAGQAVRATLPAELDGFPCPNNTLLHS